MLSALLRAVRDQIRLMLPTRAEECGVRPAPGQPPPDCGRLYVAVHPARWDSGGIPNPHVLDEHFALAVTATLRNELPHDLSQEEIFLQHMADLEDVARRVVVNVHGNYNVLTEANSHLPNTFNIIEPLVWQRTDAEPTPRGPDWFSAVGESANAYGHSMTVWFGGAKRYQYSATAR